MTSKYRVPRFALCLISWLASPFIVASTHAQTPLAAPAPELCLSVNHSFSPTISQGWPIVFELSVYTPDVAQRNGNAVPITLNLPSGSWADGVELAVIDSSGNTQTWLANLVYHPAGSDSSIVLNAGIEGILAWTVAPSNTSSIAAGTYQAVALLNASSTTAPGAFQGSVTSNPVTIVVGPEPSPLPANLQEDKYTLLATYDLLQGNRTQAMTDLNTLLTNQPNSIVGMTSMGDLLNLQGQSTAALQQYDQAVATFVAAFPTAPEPPIGLIDRQANLRAGLISQSGKVSSPQVGVSLTNQGAQSPGIYFFDLQLTNGGPGVAEATDLSQFSYLTIGGTGQVTYDTNLSPPVPVDVDWLAPGASSTVRIYLDVPATITQFTINFSGTAQDIVGTTHDFAGTQTVTPGSIGTTGAPLTITAANATRQYGQAPPPLNNVTYSGFINGDTPASLGGTLNCATAAMQSSPVGAYPITCSGLTSSNYTIAYVPGTLSITPTPLTVTANNATVQYGQAISLNAASYSGFVNGDASFSLGGTLHCTTTAIASSPVGTYPITCSGLTSTNYTISFAQGTLTVTAAPLTITPTNATRAYGAANPPLNNVAASGFVNGDTLLSLNGTLTCATSATPRSPAGAYPITCSGLTSPNYSISFVAGTLTVTPLVVSCVSNLNGRGTPSGRAPARIDVTWTGIPSAVSFNVLRATVSGGPYTLLGNAVLPAFSDTNGLVNGGTYDYVVQPINSAGGVICQSNEAAIVIPNQPR